MAACAVMLYCSLVTRMKRPSGISSVVKSVAPFGADVFSHRVFTLNHFTVIVHHFHSHIDGDVVPCISSLICGNGVSISSGLALA